ncbi:DNA modification methylase [Hamadaea flava]|uniref:Methyltransferase n=1 Tax=Hamadaea flava TaxID=1742688 RepID=A0ABV8LFL8_9ACTN|nr:DNA methyltransferase [Hamadaea flava]MCP2323407.1 DNA modification methylase [Hamadaea flava]
MDEPSVSSVWLTCQQPARDQRRGRYVPETSTHPAKMLPALAAHAIVTYTAPGDLVLDPMCGSGTTLVEAVHAGRNAIGIDIEPRYTALAEANLALAASQGASGVGQAVTGDATAMPSLLPASLQGTVGLVLTSPPYGRATHGLVRLTETGVRKHDHMYGDRQIGNLAYAGWDGLLTGFAQIMSACAALLRPGGTVVITCRPVRRKPDDFIDLPGELLRIAANAGLQTVDRCVALLAAVRGDKIVHRASMFGLMAARRARADGIPAALVAHEDVLVLRR